ncbi:MAG TPA: hypothetical protein VGV14_16970 [Rhodanobacter sp.]|nr:hypothetical protein [Rhodanobacter sp.]
MKALADYVHANRLKLGIYSSPGAKTYAGYEGSLGQEQQEARTSACGRRRAQGAHQQGRDRDHPVTLGKQGERIHADGQMVAFNLGQARLSVHAALRSFRPR